MEKTSTLFVAILLACNMTVNSQTTQKSDSILTFEKAKYLKEDLTKFLAKNIRYPDEALMRNKQGDVVISFVINRNGKLDSLAISSSPDILFSTSAIIAFNSIDEEWSPSKINGRPIDKKYIIIFRYKMYLNTQPPDYKSKAEKYFTKKNYAKALKFYNNAIKDDQYAFELFESRSKIKNIIGDIEGTKQDSITSNNLKNEVMSIVNVSAIGISRVVRTTSTINVQQR